MDSITLVGNQYRRRKIFEFKSVYGPSAFYGPHSIDEDAGSVSAEEMQMDLSRRVFSKRNAEEAKSFSSTVCLHVETALMIMNSMKKIKTDVILMNTKYQNKWLLNASTFIWFYLKILNITSNYNVYSAKLIQIQVHGIFRQARLLVCFFFFNDNVSTTVIFVPLQVAVEYWTETFI